MNQWKSTKAGQNLPYEEEPNQDKTVLQDDSKKRKVNPYVLVHRLSRVEMTNGLLWCCLINREIRKGSMMAGLGFSQRKCAQRGYIHDQIDAVPHARHNFSRPSPTHTRKCSQWQQSNSARHCHGTKAIFLDPDANGDPVFRLLTE